MPENVISLTEIKRLRNDDHKLFRLTALLEYKLKSIHTDLKISETSTGEIREDINGSPPDLFQLIIYHKHRFNNFSAIDTARKIRNKLAHPSPNDKKIDVSEISQSVDYLIKAIEGLDSIENKTSLGKYFFIGIGILFCLTIIGEPGVFGIILIAVGLIVFIAAKSSDEKNNRE